MSGGLDRDALERIVADDLDEDPQTLRAHVERYEFAARHVSGRRVLDVACGTGYGAEILLAGGAAHVLGVDAAPEAIAYARDRYGRDGISFIVGDAMTFHAGGPYDAAVSLETLEHVPDPASLVARLARHVGTGGVLVASAPISPSVDVNPFHLHDISERELRRMFARASIRVVDELRQRTSPPLATLVRGRVGRRKIRSGLLALYVRRPELFVRRVRHTLAHGLTNEYLVLAGRVDAR